MRKFNNSTDVGPKEEHWKEYAVEFDGEEAITVWNESAEEVKERIAEIKETNIDSVTFERVVAKKMNPREGITVRGHYYDIQEHNEVHG